jgi:hypothetical protein
LSEGAGKRQLGGEKTLKIGHSSLYSEKSAHRLIGVIYSSAFY